MKETLTNLKKVYNYGRKYNKNLIVFTIISLCAIGINIIMPILSARIILYLSNGSLDKLLYVAIILFIIELVHNINHIIIRKNTQVFFRGTTKNIQLDSAKEILKIKAKDFDTTSSGIFIQRIGNDADEMSKVFTRGMGYLTGILSDIGIFVSLFIINKIMFVFFLISSMILTHLYVKEVNKMNEKDKIYRKQREKTNGLIGELVRGVRDIKMLNARKSFVDEIENNIDNLTKSQFDMRNTEIKYDFIIDVAFDLINLLLVVLSIVLLKNNLITVAAILVVFNYRYRVLGNLMYNFGELMKEIKSFNLSSNRVFSLTGNKEFKKEKFGKKHIDNIKGNFEFKNVHFSYDKKEVLKGINFKIKENETVAFVGKSGEGKTTIFNLLCKMYDIKSGEILIDGKNIKDLDEDSIRGNITIISQSPYIFNLSIRDNLRLVKDNMTDDEMIDALKKACLYDFVQTLPDKYDTIVGEGGITLSGGQRQRLAIARAFIQDTKIILFDEATSALDNETQSLIHNAISNMKEKYTILIIAHRLSTVINSDRILFLEDGVITDEGTHDELLKKNKNYKKLNQTELRK